MSLNATLPYAGQGANQAIEDAIVLANMIEEEHKNSSHHHKHSMNYEAAFGNYFRKRFQRTKLVVDTSRQMGIIFHTENPVAAMGRDLLLTFLLRSGMVMKIAEKELFENCPV